MEYLLIDWLEDCNQKWIPIGTNNIMVKALYLFSSLNEKKLKGVTIIFSASRGWFEILKLKLECIMKSFTSHGKKLQLIQLEMCGNICLTAQITLWLQKLSLSCY
jgi:hypothetical protein